MKKLSMLLMALVLVFTFNSCRGDDDSTDSGQYGFTIQRDSTFPEKGVGETNQLLFNIVPEYTFGSITTSYKFSTNLNGTLKLNGTQLTADQSYNFASKDNTFEYTGNEAGDHVVKIVVTNSKGVTKTETFNLKYAVSQFSHTFTGGSSDIYQGNETNYVMKVVPGAGQSSTGYQIKFNAYPGSIKLNGSAVAPGQFYLINDINAFNVALTTAEAGAKTLSYTIKNSTVSKDYELLQTVKNRQVVIESMNLSANSVLTGSQATLSGVIKKLPNAANSSIKYKTWISAANNNNMAGLQNTNNVYTASTLGANGAFSLNFNAVAAGTYTYNIQAQDEFGNESEVKSFNITVENHITFIGGQSGSLDIGFRDSSSTHRASLKGFTRTVQLQAGGNEVIASFKYQINFTHKGTNYSYTYNEGSGNATAYNIQASYYDINPDNNYITYIDPGADADIIGDDIPTNGTIKFIATTTNGVTVETSVPVSISYTPM